MPSHGYKCPDSLEQDPIRKTIDKYRDHPSTKLINQNSLYRFISGNKSLSIFLVSFGFLRTYLSQKSKFILKFPRT